MRSKEFTVRSPFIERAGINGLARFGLRLETLEKWSKLRVENEELYQLMQKTSSTCEKNPKACIERLDVLNCYECVKAENRP